MGAVIRAAAAATPGHGPRSHGARRLADEAATRCLRDAGISSDDLDLLVNVGVFRERGLGEPALAALVQEDIGANLGHPPVGGHGTFSFDLDDGACGVLTGMHLVRGFLESRAIHWGLVVGSDSGPDPIHAGAVPYAESGGAVLLTWDDVEPGLVAHRSATFPEYEGLAQSRWSWQRRAARRPHDPGGRPTLVVERRPGYAEKAASCAAEVAAALLSEHHVPDVDLLIATHGPGFGDAVADRLDLPHARVLHAGEGVDAMHTAAPAAAVALAVRQGRWAEAHRVLLVSAGAGISVAASLYLH
jgi:3-oxoacyl-[acyl-carrier-protein] synthase-3